MAASPATPASIHPQARAILDRIVASGEPPLETLSVEAARAVADPRVIRTAGKGPEVGAVEDRAIPGPAGQVPLRLYRPKSSGGTGPLPVLLYIHGGGYVLGNLDTADAICRELVVRAGCIVVSAHYRLAPEHKFPAAAEDCYAAALWTARHAAALGGDPRRIAIGGESAGGTLTAVITQQGRDRGELGFVLQIMVYPSTDVGATFPSHLRLAEGYFLTPRKMRWFHDHYIRDASDAEDPRASPLRCKDFTQLPPALVITGGLDPLVDEGAAYADKLAAAGVPTVYRCYEGWPHGFMYWAGTEAHARAFDEMAAALRRSFGL
jgi:acetyl esterase